MYKKIIFVFQFILLLLFSFTLVNAENTLSKDIPFGQSIGSSEYFGSVLDNSDLEELWNGEITFQSIDYSTHEELNLDSSDLLISTSLSSQDDDYETNIYLETNRNSISFYYVFDDSIDLTSTTSVDPITIEFLGSTFEIVSIDSATEFTAIVGGSEETFGDGDPYYAEDSSNPNWVWDLDNLDVSGTSQIFGIENDFVYSSLMDSTITDGNCLSLPKDYVSICFDDLTLQESDYGSYRFEVDTATDLSDVIPSLTSVHTLYILTPVYEGMTLSPYTASETIASSSSAVDVNEVWLYYPGMTDTLSDGSAAPTSTGVVWLGVFYRDPADYLIKEFGHVAMNAENEIVKRFLRFSESQDYGLFVALSESKNVIGWVQVNEEPNTLLVGRRADISTLVVDEKFRRNGIGKALLSQAEKWAQLRGIAILQVKSNIRRDDAHRFYQREGFILTKTSYSFTKTLIN